jgi:predicted type IV restriction endonuclease
MEKKLIEFIESLKATKRLKSMDEASTKQAIVIKMLSLLDWDIFNVDEVKPNLAVKTQVVDYALRKNKMNTIFIRVKKVSEELDSHQKEILGSAIAEGVKLAILTNGVIWWFYLPFQEGSSDQKRFCAIDLLRQKPIEVVLKLINLLEKSNVTSGKALKKAEVMHETRQTRVIDKSLSEAWKKLLSRPPDALIKLINETVVKIGGYRADEKVIVKYLNAWARGEAGEEIIDLKEPLATPSETFEGLAIKSFTFKDQSYSVDSWERFLVKLCELMAAEYNKDLEALLWHSVDNKFFFRDNPEELRLPLNIKGTNIFVETAMSPDVTMKVARSVLEAFGYAGSDLDIKIEEKK